MKRIVFLLTIATVTSLAIISCKDDFNEADFLRLQDELRNRQDSINRARDRALVDSTSKNAVQEYVNALNEAGDLLAVTILVRENGVPVADVTVSLTTGSTAEYAAGRTKAVQSASTDASGTVVFDRVVIGAGSISFSKNGYVGATASVNFGTPAEPVQITIPNANGSSSVHFIPPGKRFEEAVIPLFSATPGAGSTATVSGRVSIENDVTNLSPEVPLGIVIRANLAALADAPSSSFITNYALEDNSGLGAATVDANGNYTMTVPATASGTEISLVIPNVDGTCRMAVNSFDNGTGTASPLAGGPEYRDVPTSWGPEATSGFGTTIPAVAGAKIIFPVAPPAGAGLAFDFTRVPKGIVTGTFSSSQITNIGGNLFAITSRGAYTDGPAPTVQISGGGGSGAEARALMRTFVSSLTVVDNGEGYTGAASINIVRTDANGTDFIVARIAVPTVGGELPSTIDLANFQGPGNAGFSNIHQASLGHAISSLSISVTGGGAPITSAVVTGTFKTELEGIEITNSGSGYLTAPTISLSGGNTTTQATAHCLDFPVYWTIVPNNSAASAYSIMPNSMSISYAPTPEGQPASSSLVDVFSSSGVPEGNFTLLSRLTVVNGQVVKKELERILRTTTRSSSQPTIEVLNQVPANASRILTATNINTATGAISSFPAGTSNGNGYNLQFNAIIQPTIAGAPGSGAMVSLSGQTFDVNTLEWTWTGAGQIAAGGTNYLPNLNRRSAQTGSFPSAVTVQSGKVYTLDVTYGTGNRKVNIN
jgi:hypothetical protein